MNAAHKANDLAKRLDRVCDQIRFAVKVAPGTDLTAKRELRNRLFNELVEMDGNYDRADRIAGLSVG